MPDFISLLLIDWFKNENTVSQIKYMKAFNSSSVAKSISHFFSFLIDFSIEQYDQLLFFPVVIFSFL